MVVFDLEDWMWAMMGHSRGMRQDHLCFLFAVLATMEVKLGKPLKATWLVTWPLALAGGP